MNSPGDGRPLVLVVPHSERRQIMAAVLTDAGYQVDSTGDVGKAVERIRASLPAAVVTDITPGKEDSFQLLHLLRDTEGGAAADVPVVISSGRNRDVDQVRAWELGCDGFVSRPHYMAELLDALEEVVDLDPPARARRREERFRAVRRRVAGKRARQQTR